MIDDPLGLVVQMVAVLAAGMYPIGFMFGVCSDCCCPPCDRCTYTYMGSPDAPILPSAYTMEFLGQEVTVDAANLNDPAYELTLADFECNGEQIRLTVYFQNFDNVLCQDKCGCSRFFIQPAWRFAIYVDDVLSINPSFVVPDLGTADGVLDINDPKDFGCGVAEEGPFYKGYFAEDWCATGEVTRTYGWYLSNGNPITQRWSPWQAISYDAACTPAELDDAVLTVTYEFDAVCECGACCRETGCEDNVTESWCENEAWTAPAGTWQGVGTDCDPDPCSE